MALRRISDDAGHQAFEAWHGGASDPDTLAIAVRYSLQELKDLAPGKSVEVRVPPYGAVQVIEGPSHTRGTPPAVVETGPQVWLELATGLRTFESGVLAGLVRASGERSDLSAWLPIVSLP